MLEIPEPRPVRLDNAWPEDGLEHLGKCPVCSSIARDVLYAGLTDVNFKCAPGVWTLWTCLTCHCAYLDPRPDANSIGRAYSSYYTHGSHNGAPGIRLLVKDIAARIRLWAAHDYLNHRHGHKLRPTLPGGRWIGALMPHYARIADGLFRHLPPPTTPEDAVLDIGCGDGAFLLKARRMGYRAIGLEPDETAARRARASGLDVVVGRLPASCLPANTFSQVTMNHVFEHLHEPVASLQEIHRLLRPGGRLWLAMPNLDSSDHDRDKGQWFHLDPPRHLVLFGPDVTKTVLERAGFKSVSVAAPRFAKGRFSRSTQHLEGGYEVLATAYKD